MFLVFGNLSICQFVCHFVYGKYFPQTHKETSFIWLGIVFKFFVSLKVAHAFQIIILKFTVAMDVTVNSKYKKSIIQIKKKACSKANQNQNLT